MTELNTFDWSGFQPKDLRTLNREKNPDIYGAIYNIAGKTPNIQVQGASKERKEKYGRNQN